jgi:hypothetical protein
MTLFNGQNGSKSDGRGAVTVANLNDTDGDEIVDNIDPSVISTSGKGRNEVDLMKLIIKKNVTINPDQLFLKKIAGDISLWRTPNKGDSFAFNSDNVAFLSSLTFDSNDEAILYVEAKSVSPTVKNINLQLNRYNGGSPEVCDNKLATAFWFEGEIKQVDNSPSPIPGTNDLPYLDNDELIGRINNLYISESGQRWGHGFFNSGDIDTDTYTDLSDLNKRFGGRILFEFSIIPNITQGNNMLFIDITRQKKVRTHRFDHNEEKISLRTDMISFFDFPEELNTNNELPNDDKNSLDEDNLINNSFVYSIDVPATLLKRDNFIAFLVQFMSFKEFVRITPYGSSNIFGVNALKGSRASLKIPWNNSYYTKMGINEKLEGDFTQSSVSQPIKIDGIGNGNIQATISGNITTNSFEITLFTANGQKKARLRDFNSIQTESVFTNGSCNLTLGGVSISIIDGSIPFSVTSKWRFNTFKSFQPQKINSISSGTINVLIDP